MDILRILACLIDAASGSNRLQTLVVILFQLVLLRVLVLFLQRKFGFQLFLRFAEIRVTLITLEFSFLRVPLLIHVKILSLFVPSRRHFHSLKMRRARGHHFRRVLNRKRRLRKIRGKHPEPILAVGHILRGLDHAGFIDVAVSASGRAVGRSDLRPGRSWRAVAETVLAQAVLIAKEHRLGKAGSNQALNKKKLKTCVKSAYDYDLQRFV